MAPDIPHLRVISFEIELLIERAPRCDGWIGACLSANIVHFAVTIGDRLKKWRQRSKLVSSNCELDVTPGSRRITLLYSSCSASPNHESMGAH